MQKLPIDDLLPELRVVLTARTEAVLTAPPGSGKTTRIPLALLAEPWLAGRRIILLEPRRLAARAAAHYMAALLGERVGETVGYRMRLDTKVSANTRIEVVTEGVLTRMLQTDPALEHAGIVIFDEFHERSLHADLGLALSLESQSVLRPDLRLLVMSATLAAAPVAALMNKAPVLAGEGQIFPVITHWLSAPLQEAPEPAVCRLVSQALAAAEGDILVFLPGAAEIRRVESLLQAKQFGQHVQIAPLFGALSQSAQDAALLPSLPGRRKIVLATSIAETSLTIEGVRVVIDSGLMRLPSFSPRTGMTRLETISVSADTADQRRGRAGRTGPGVCFRLWTEAQEKRLEPHNKPEILKSDLAPLALELAAWGIDDPANLKWLDVPPAAALAQGRDLLRRLDALDGTKITGHGRCLAALGLNPRLSHMLVTAAEAGLGGLACDLAAVLNERDILPVSRQTADVDLRLRLELLSENNPLSRRLAAAARQWRSSLGLKQASEGSLDDCGLVLAFAYPDRIAQRRPDGRFLLANGRGAILTGAQPLAGEDFLCVADVDDKGAESRIFLAAPVKLADLRRHFAAKICQETSITWDRESKRLRARQMEKLDVLVLSERMLAEPDPQACLAVLLTAIQAEGKALLPWSRAASQLQQRVCFMHHINAAWPDFSDEHLYATLADWLMPYLYGIKSGNELQRLNIAAILEGRLTYEQRRELEECAPAQLAVPSGRRITIDYSNPEAPVLAVRLQELFGLAETPRLGRGKVALTLHLLSPAQRPVQITQDLASFWQNGYPAVKRELLGRYPKHYWPDDPLQAVPTDKVRPCQ